MPDRVSKVSYAHMSVPNRPGQGPPILELLRENGVDLYAFHAFPGKPRQTQVDLVPRSMAALRGVARRNGWKLSTLKKGFLIQGEDRLGALERHVNRLADARINVTAGTAVAAGKGRYGMILWVRPKDYARAAKVLKAR